MNFSAIKHFDIANGVGVRTTLFVSGCRLRCPGCFNSEAWDFASGKSFTREVEDALIESLRPSFIDGLSILGGEPFEPENQAGLVDFIERVRAELPTKSIWMYSGHTWEELYLDPWHTPVTDRILSCIDVLVDGPWHQDEYDITLRFRGSKNQRIIDVPATLAAHKGERVDGATLDGATLDGATPDGVTLAANDVILWHDDPLFERNNPHS